MNNLYLIEQLQAIIENKDIPTIVEDISTKLVDYIQQDNSFINSLTLSELEVFNVLKTKFLTTNTIVISSSVLAAESKVSRTTVSNLFSKMKNAQIAEINNLGVKGTYIHIINSNILKN